MTAPVLICGAGIAGLWAALAISAGAADYRDADGTRESALAAFDCAPPETSAPRDLSWIDLSDMAQLADILPSDADPTCTPVRLSGHMRATDDASWSVLFPDLMAAYSTSPLEQSAYVTLADFDDWQTPFTHNGAPVTVSGLLRPVCRTSSGFSGRWVTSRPSGSSGLECEPQDTLHWILMSPRIVTADAPEQRIRGDENRQAIGELLRVDLPDEMADVLRQDWRDHATWLSRGNHEAGTFEDFLHRSPVSPFVARTDFVETAELGLFIATSRPDDTSSITCICTHQTCDGNWPVLLKDTQFVFRDYVCEHVVGAVEPTRFQGERQ